MTRRTRAESRTATALDVRSIREELGLSQTEMAALLGVSPRTIQSCEQRWRQPSPALERAALLLLVAHRNGSTLGKRICWTATGCDRALRTRCTAYLSRQGHLCWFLTGTLCKGVRLRTWADKVERCLECSFFRGILRGELPVVSRRGAGRGVACRRPGAGRAGARSRGSARRPASRA